MSTSANNAGFLSSAFRICPTNQSPRAQIAAVLWGDSLGQGAVLFLKGPDFMRQITQVILKGRCVGIGSLE